MCVIPQARYTLNSGYVYLKVLWLSIPLIRMFGLLHVYMWLFLGFYSPFSAGIGRSGVFIASCLGVMSLEDSGEVDILKLVSTMRQDRGGMVQSRTQYIFLHKVCLRHIANVSFTWYPLLCCKCLSVHWYEVSQQSALINFRVKFNCKAIARCTVYSGVTNCYHTSFEYLCSQLVFGWR